MIVSILGKRWRLRFVPLKTARGDCSAPSDTNKEIRIHSTLTGEERLEILIHEFRHAADWGRDEDFVAREPRDMARMLWRLGYRTKQDLSGETNG